MSEETFATWILGHKDEASAIGDLARDIFSAREQGLEGAHARTYAAIKTHLLDNYACDAALATLETAYSDYKEYIKNVPFGGCVYFVQAIGPIGYIKIGYTKGPVSKRMSLMQTGNAEEIQLLGAMPGNMEKEKQLHARFSGYRVRGEWFEPAQELLEFIKGTNGVKSNYCICGQPHCQKCGEP